MRRSVFFIFLIYLSVLTISNLFAQKNLIAQYQLSSHSFEGPISPELYVLGPGDVLVYSLWGEKNFSYTLPVTPQGKLILPNVGEFTVSGKSLKSVKSLLDERTKKLFSPASTTLTLKSVRTFRVHVTGEIRHPGVVIIPAIDRVSDAINMAGGLTKKSSLRNIEIIGKDNLNHRVDLLAYK
ncbi:MAG TPA: hypothetical protein ENG82_03675, partial [Bacteroidetes bacterium]|nr:hypothetical protein [Bacteroidota bacterium]